MQLLSTQSVLLAAVLAVLLPVFVRISRVVLSPINLILFSPLLILLVFLTFLTTNVFFGYLLDTLRPRILKPLRHTARPLAFSTPAAWQAVLTRAQWSHKSPQALGLLYPESPAISTAFNDILTMIVRDFVWVWYKELSISPSFPTAVSSTMHSSMENLLRRVSSLDLSSLVVKRILPKITAHIEQFRQSEVALRGAGLRRHLTQSDELDLLLASRYIGRGGKLHPAVDNLSTSFTKQSEDAHLRQLIEKALPFILPEPEASSVAVKIVVREIVACAVLGPIMELLSDPDFWNRSIDQVAGAAIRQQKLISKVRNILEAQLPRPPRSQVPPSQTQKSALPENITIRTDARQFESFLRSISRYNSLLDARRLKNDIVGEIRRTRILLANHENEDWVNGEKTEDVVAFLDRLYTAKRKIEKRIAILGGDDDSRRSIFHDPSSPPRLSLRDVLTNPSSLSYFMEFMDRRGRSLLVQFWLTVESFKNPLESIDSGSSGDDNEPLMDPAGSATVKEDMSMMVDLYFSNPKAHPALSAVSQKHVDAIRAFVLDDSTLSPVEERRVRRTVMLSQRQVEQDMEQDFDDFQRSALWFRVIGDTDLGNRKAASFPRSPKQNEPSTPAPPTPGLIATLTSSFTFDSGRERHSPLDLRPSPGATPCQDDSSPQDNVSSRPGRRSWDSERSLSSLQMITATSQSSSRLLPSNLDVLMSSASDAASDSSRAPLFDDSEDRLPQGFDHAQAQLERMEAIQAAITDIMDHDKRQTERPRSYTSSDGFLNKSTSDLEKIVVGSESRRVFSDMMSEEDISLEGLDDTEEPAHGAFQLAAPGDLQLSYEIARLSDKISNLMSQDSMLDTLIRKAELTGDAQELRLLRKSKAAMGREIRELTFQKTQYQQQESANRLVSDRTNVAIVNSTVGEEEGKAVVRYLVEVQQLAHDGNFASGWVVARRYNEFLNMHQRLRERYLMVRNLDFPGKRLVTALSASFVDNRRTALEKYMQSLIAIPIVCESDELRSFLSRDSPFMTSDHPPTTPKSSGIFPGQGLVHSVYQSVAGSIDDMFFGPSMLDVMIQRLTRQAAEFTGIVGSGVNDEDLVAQALKASGQAAPDTLLRLPGDLKPIDGETSTSTFTAPICDLILAVFELDKTNNWLRRQAIVIILQQVLGGTIERKLRDMVKSYLDETHVMSLIKMFRDNLWPGGRLKPPSVPRTTEEKLHTRDEANRKLSTLIPDLAANMIGRSNARRGARRIFAVLQNRRLNQHILYTVVDEIFTALFPDAS